MSSDRSRLCPPFSFSSVQSLIVEDADFQGLLRVLNTNVQGSRKVMYALCQIRGIGRRFANLICKKAEVDLNKRAGELTEEELEALKLIIAQPLQFNIPNWFLNNQKDHKDGKYTQLVSNQLDTKLRDNLERMKKIRSVEAIAERRRECGSGGRSAMPRFEPPAHLLLFLWFVVSACTAVFVTSGASACAASTPRPPAAAVLASPCRALSKCALR